MYNPNFLCVGIKMTYLSFKTDILDHNIPTHYTSFNSPHGTYKGGATRFRYRQEQDYYTCTWEKSSLLKRCFWIIGLKQKRKNIAVRVGNVRKTIASSCFGKVREIFSNLLPRGIRTKYRQGS